jgi:hypothetical protein
MQDNRKGVWVVSIIAAQFLAEEAFDVNYLAGETMNREKSFHLLHAQQVPMVFARWADDVLSNFIHLEKIRTDGTTGHATEFLDGGFQAFD